LSTDEERSLIHRLAAGELDALEEVQARALIEREPELAALLAQLSDLQSRVRAAFPEPPPLGESRAFVGLMDRLAAAGFDEQPPADATWSMGERTRALDDAAPSAPLVRAARRSLAFRGEATPRAPEASPGAHLFHLREIQREDGLSVELEFYAGDVLAVRNEVLLVSAFAGSYLPTPGSIFGAIADRYGIEFASGPPLGATRHPGGLLHFPVSCPAFDSLWVIEMRAPLQPFTLVDLRSALDAIGDRLSDMLAEASSITLPLLGTGYQRLDPRDVARELLSALPRWARNPRLRMVRVFAHGLEDVALLNRALDDRDFSASNSALLSACQELRRRLDREDWREPVRAALKDLLQIASAPDPSLQSIALEGRRIAEVVLRLLSREEGAVGDLFAAEGDASGRRRADLAAPHLQLLLAHGRSAAAGERVDSSDAVMVVYAAMRVAEMTLV
jgi:hypothetical protein